MDGIEGVDGEGAGVVVRVRLRSDVSLRPDGEGGTWTLTHPWGAARVHGGSDLPGDVLATMPCLARLDVVGSRGVLVGVEAVGPSAPVLAPVPAGIAAHPSSTLVLGRHAFLRREHADRGGGTAPGECAVLESASALHRAVLVDPRVAALVALLAAPTPWPAAARQAGLDVTEAAPVRGLLLAAGLLGHAGVRGPGGAEPDEPTSRWEFHDLLFHTRSRLGRHDGPVGAVHARRGGGGPLPAIPAPRPSAGPDVVLAVPAFADVVAADPPLTRVLEGRRSVRRHERTITVGELGELLYRTARARRVLPARDGGAGQDTVDRPYPTGGRVGDLELCLAVRSCEGLPPGGYRYDSAAHRLLPVDGAPDALDALLAGARRATGNVADPQVLVTVTTRMGRLTWTYGRIAYALTLKHVGGLLQTAHLVATAMGVGMCALGGGDVDAATRAYGLTWPEETSVGEFLLGGGPLPVEVEGFADLTGRRG